MLPAGTLVMAQTEIQQDLKNVLATINDGFIAVDRDWHCTYVNKKAADLIGLDWHDLLGRTLWNVFPELIGSSGHHQLVEAMALRTPVHFENFFPRCDRWFEHRSYPSDNGLVIFSVDITQRKEDELRLIEAQERLAATCDHAPVGIAETDAKGRYTRVNAKWCEITGYSRAELLQRTFADLTRPEDLLVERERYRALLTGDLRAYDMEKRYIRKDGSISWVQVHRSALQDRNGTMFAIGTLQDISARKEAEAK